jgi:hypothetical protein
MPPPDLLPEALRAGLSTPITLRSGRQRVVVAGGAGPLGAAVLEQVLAGPFAQVAVLVRQSMGTALRDLQTWQLEDWQVEVSPRQQAEVGVVVFDMGRSRHGREAAFLQPTPEDLPALAEWLLRCGVQQLVVVMPHAPGQLPQALRAGLANLDEQAVAKLGFVHTVFVRPARAEAGQRASPGAPLARLGRGLLAQLHWMVPLREQPLRASKVAAFVAQLAAALPAAPPGTRVAASELIWDWAQPEGGRPVLQAWLHGQTLPSQRATAARW